MVTAMASPSLLRMTVTIIDDSNLTMTASVQNAVHASGPTGKLVGIMTVTNHASAAIRITVAMATIQSVAPASPFTTTITIAVPLIVPAGATLTVSFSGPFTGNLLLLKMTDSFLIAPSITWFSGTAGPFTYSQMKICTGPGPSATTAFWTSGSCTSA